MAGNTNFPTALDDDTSLHDVVDGVTEVVAAHHNNLKEATKKLEQKLGIYGTDAPTTIDYRLGNPTGSHSHNGASGQGRLISATLLGLPTVGGIPSGGNLQDHLSNIAIHGGATDALGQRTPFTLFYQGSIGASANFMAPAIIGRTMQLESISAALRRGPSGATLALTTRFGPSAVFGASVGFRPIFPAGATAYRSSATPNVMTYPSGAIITVDADAVGSSDPGQDLTITFVFRG